MADSNSGGRRDTGDKETCWNEYIDGEGVHPVVSSIWILGFGLARPIFSKSTIFDSSEGISIYREHKELDRRG